MGNMTDKLRIPEEEGDVIDVFLQPDTQPYIAKRKELIEQSGMSEDEVDSYLQTSPIQLEIFYTDVGLFGVESESLDSCEIFNPYTGVEIPNDNLSY